MKRRDFLKHAGLSGAAGATAGAAMLAAQAHAQPATVPQNVHWCMGASWRKSDGPFFEGAERIARRVAELTDGKFQIRVSAAGEIVEGAQVLDAVRTAKLEIGHTSLDYYVGREPAFGFAASIPFGLDHRHQSAWMASGGGREAMQPLFREYGLVQIPAGSTGAQVGAWSRREIRSVEDLKGMKLGIGGLAGEIYARLGAEPQALAEDALYPALQKGSIDAAEWVSPHDDRQRGFHKVASYYYYPGLWEAGPQLSTVINLKKWQELPKTYQIALETACSDAAVHMSAQYDTKNPQALRRLLAEGVRLHTLPQAVLQAAEAASNRLYAELAAKSAHWKRIYALWTVLRDEQQLWSRLAQYGMDSFSYTPRGQSREPAQDRA